MRLTPPWHCADITSVKSPESIFAVGMNVSAEVGRTRSLVICGPAKKNHLFLISGPPRVPPVCALTRPSSAMSKCPIELSEWWRPNANPSP